MRWAQRSFLFLHLRLRSRKLNIYLSRADREHAHTMNWAAFFTDETGLKRQIAQTHRADRLMYWGYIAEGKKLYCQSCAGLQRRVLQNMCLPSDFYSNSPLCTMHYIQPFPHGIQTDIYSLICLCFIHTKRLTRHTHTAAVLLSLLHSYKLNFSHGTCSHSFSLPTNFERSSNLVQWYSMMLVQLVERQQIIQVTCAMALCGLSSAPFTFTRHICYVFRLSFLSADFWGANLFPRTKSNISNHLQIWPNVIRFVQTETGRQICISASESIGFKSNVHLSPPFSVYLCFAIFLSDLSYRIHHNPYSLPLFRRHFAVSSPIPFAVVNLLMEVRRFLFITTAKTSSLSAYWLQIEFPSSFHLSSGSQAVRRLHFPVMHSAFTQLTLRLPLFSIL